MFKFEGMKRVEKERGERRKKKKGRRRKGGMMLRDAALVELYPEVVFLIGFALITMTAAALRFSKRLD